MPYEKRTLAITAMSIASLGGCTMLRTTAGHPDSYQYSSYYKVLQKKAWDTKLKAETKSAGTTTSPVFVITRTPAEIWQARGYAFNLSLKYEAASYKAQAVQDSLAIPLFGAAIAVAVTAITHASTVAIAATGVGGAAVGAGYTYLQPGKDATADQTARSALLCIVDQGKILTDMSAVPLVLDKAALQGALDQLASQAGPLSRDTTPATQSARTALKAAQDAGEAAIKALNLTISAYVQLPGEIYQAVDGIDATAKSAGLKTIDYAGLLKTIQTSVTNQAATDAAKTQTQAATKSAAEAGKPGAPGSTQTKNSPASAPLIPGNATVPQSFADIENAVKDGAANAPMPSAASGQADGTDVSAGDQGGADKNDTVSEHQVGTPTVNNGQDKSATLESAFNDQTMSAVDRVNYLASIATNDIPDPSFSTIAGAIKACNPAISP